jgi:23S rRNA pseudoU1915 N3-methylase RlmH
MRKIIKPEEFPIEMNEGNIEILANMANENPVSIEWIECSKKLSDDEKFQVYEKRGELLKRQERERLNSLTQEEQEEEKKIEASMKEGPDVFRGNILQQEWDSIELARLAQEKTDKENRDKS